MRIKNYILFLCFVSLLFTSKAQQLPIYQHSFLIRSAYNPAEVLNTKNDISIYALRGNQFQKFQGGFVNNYANFSTPLDNMNIGLGLDMASRTYGPINQLSVGFAYAYRVRFNESTSLVFGTRLGFIEHKFNKSQINPYQEDDYIINAIPDGHLLPNGNFGVTLRSKLGVIELAIPQLLSNRFLNTISPDIQSITLHPHLFSRYSIDLNVVDDKVLLSPIASIRYLPGTIPQYELGMTATFNNSLWFNANYRSSYSISLGVGVKANDKWSIGYSYDRPIVNRFSFNANNHEVVLGYTFERGKAKSQIPEWTQAENVPFRKMDSISDIRDVSMAEDFLRNKLAAQKKQDSVAAYKDSITRSSNSNYKSITVEINLADSLFQSSTSDANKTGFGEGNSKNDKGSNSNDRITQTDIDEKLRQLKEEEYLEKLNKNNPNKIKIVRNEQPSEKYFVELSGEDSPRGYYLITGVFSTLDRAQKFRWKSDSELAKIIFNKKNQYFYVVYSYSEAKLLKELEPILKEYRSKSLKMWILDY